MNHLKTIFSSEARKAWAGFLVATLAPFVVQYLSSVTADSVTGFFGRYGLQISDGLAAVVVGVCGLLVVYFTKNKANGR